MQIRKYQYDISRVALFDNTLVCLPTGLGKTFIAAVVMYNFYRWYPQGIIVFVAPTRILVDQQVNFLRLFELRCDTNILKNRCMLVIIIWAVLKMI